MKHCYIWSELGIILVYLTIIGLVRLNIHFASKLPKIKNKNKKKKKDSNFQKLISPEPQSLQGSPFFHMRGRWGRESIGEVVTSREGFKKLMLRTAVFNYLPPKFQGKSRFLTIFCKNCPGRYSKVMEEWRSLL